MLLTSLWLIKAHPHRGGSISLRLDQVRQQLQNQIGRNDLVLVEPPWESGRVDLMLLDTQVGQTTTVAVDNDSLVRGVIASQAPSLSDGELAALFHARLDRRGAALLVASLEGQVNSLAGVLYDLEFNVLRPAVDLKMRADLDRCANAFTIGAGVSIYYVAADIQATFAELQETGAIEIELTTEIADPETQKMVNASVEDFYDTLMRELFRPSVAPMQGLVTAAGTPPTPQAAPVRFRFAYTRTQSNRHIEVNYNTRMARRRRHNPQAHLAALRGLATTEDVIQRVPLSVAWREVEVEAALPGGFMQPSLNGVSLVIWRGRDPVLPPESAHSGGLRMPAGVNNLARFDFSRDDPDPRHLQFVTQPDEPPFYRWQAKLTYAREDDVDSPLEFWSVPRMSSSADLDVFPDVLSTTHEVRLSLGAGHGDDLESVVADITARRPNGDEEATHRLHITPSETEARWVIRRPEEIKLTVEAALQLIYSDGRQLQLPTRRVVEPDLIVNSPFRQPVSLAPLVVGAGPEVLLVTLEITYEDAATGYRDRRLLRLAPPDFVLPPLNIPVLHGGDRVSWKSVAILNTGATEPIAQGETEGGTVLLNFVTGRVIRVQWLGLPLVDEGLRFVRVSLRARDEAGLITAEETVEWRAGVATDERQVTLPRGDLLQWREERRFNDGTRETSDFKPLLGDLLAIAP